MGYQVLARKFRPQRFADVAGQDHVTRTLMNALTQQRVAHGYIFSGHRGIGKTTISRILAQALNCHHEIGSTERPTPEPCGQCDACQEIRQGSAVDVIEIDAATNRGIDEIRELRDAARYAPSRDRYKIYILDEAHQITDAAFNALLKTLEEPPSHVIFMMATTQPEDIPQTIRSRCQHFSFHAVKFDEILGQLEMIAREEQVEAEPASLALLAEAGDGSMRDALSIMDQAIASAPLEDGRPKLDAGQIRDLMGSVPNAIFERLLEAVAQSQSAELMEQLSVLLNAGHSPSSLARQMARYLRNALMAKLGGEQTELLQTSADERTRAMRTAALFTEEELTRNLQIVLRTFDELNYRQEQRFHLELGLLKLIHAQRLLPLEELLSGVAQGGGFQSSTAPQAAPSRPAAPPAPSRASTPAPARTAQPSEAPSYSPFGNGSPFGGSPFGGGTMSSNSAMGSERREPAPVAVMPSPAAPVAVAPPAFAPATVAASAIELPTPITEGALARIAEPEPISAEPEPASTHEAPSQPQNQANVEALRASVCAALSNAGHQSAAQLLGAGNWSQDDAGVRIDVFGIGKKMLGLTVNAAAEKLIRTELQQQGLPPRFLLTLGEGQGSGGTAPSAAPLAGSVREAALSHPLVARAREIFQAEVRSVVDLRQK